MTDAQIPACRTPAVVAGCEVCHTQDTTWLSSFAGRRCDTHRPRFELAWAARISRPDPASALAYVRAFAAWEAS